MPTVHFPLDEKLPLALIEKLVQARVRKNDEAKRENNFFLRQDYAAVKAAFSSEWSNGKARGASQLLETKAPDCLR